MIFMFVVDLFDALMLLIGAIILGFIYARRSWMLCVLYIFLAMFISLSVVIRIGTQVSAVGELKHTADYINFFSLMLVPFFTVACYYVFQLYKELRALALDAGSGVRAPDSGSGVRAPDAASNYSSFSGRGFRMDR